VKNHEKIAFGREFLGEKNHTHTRVIARELFKKNEYESPSTTDYGWHMEFGKS